MSAHVFMAAARIPSQDIPVRGTLECRLGSEPVSGEVNPDGFITLSTPRAALSTLTRLRRDAGHGPVVAVELVIPNTAYRAFLGLDDLVEGLDPASEEKWFVISYPKRCLKSLADFLEDALPEVSDEHPYVLRHDLVYQLRDLPEFRQAAAIDYQTLDVKGRPLSVTQVLRPEAVRLRSARNLPQRVKIVSPFQAEDQPEK